MSKTNSLSLVVASDKIDKIEELLLAFNELENVHGRLQLFFQAAQGACFEKLQLEYGFARGHHGSKPTPCGFKSWEEYLEKKHGISDQTARRKILVWQGMRPLLGKLSPAELERVHEFMRRPMLHMPAAEVKVLEKITHKITDADTQGQFLLECGFLKAKRGDVRSHTGKSTGGGGGGSAPDEGTLVQEDFYDSLKDLIDFSEKTVKRGKGSISRLALIPHDRWLTHRADLKALIAKGDALHGIKGDK